MMYLVVYLVDLMLTSFTERYGDERNFRSIQFFDLLLMDKGHSPKMGWEVVMRVFFCTLMLVQILKIT